MFGVREAFRMTRKESATKRTDDILDAAIQEFLERGYEGTSMDRIATRAGLTKGGLYHHFSSKDEVLLSANERFMAPVATMMKRALAARSPSAGLRAYCGEYLSYWSTRHKDLAFFVLSMSKALCCQQYWSSYSRARTMMVDFLEQLATNAVEREELQISKPSAWAFALFAALEGALTYVAMDESLSAKDVAHDLGVVFIESFRTPPVSTIAASPIRRKLK
jgi:AcrR family transcriptional regulator